ncbi:MAG TPA: hypothetical protein VJS19_09350 [Candidatus Dormibacteraeota bacterium]|nr:hypothetical protein [Candidatus Dormibacteraeota bacterium]
MTDENFRADLNRAFDEVAGSPSSNLRDRVRGAIATPTPVRGTYWIAAVAAAVIAVLLVGVLVVGGPMRGSFSPAGGPHPRPSPPAATPSPTPSATPNPTPSATPSQQPQFVCGGQPSPSRPGTPPPLAYVSAVRTGSHTGYDRLTIEFGNHVPQAVDIKDQGTTFTMSPSGQSVTLKGDRGILITIHGADLHTSYTGSTDIVTGDPTIAEVRRIQDFEGVVQLGLGVSGSGCYRVMWMTNPDRLVIDVQSS